MMNTQWTAQDVERFREQQRWRLRQKSHASQQQLHQPHYHTLETPSTGTSNNENERPERTRKVSLKFRREHQQFSSKDEQNPHRSTAAVAMRPIFALAPPFSKQQRRQTAESPLPHTSHIMFNAFDSATSPEAFALEQSSNQDDERQGSAHSSSEEDHDVDMSNDNERICNQQPQQQQREQDDDANHPGSLWRRRFYVPGVERRSPKLGQVALWDGHSTGFMMMTSNHAHPFAAGQYDDDHL